MQSSTSLGQRQPHRPHQRRWIRIIGTGTTALVAAAALSSVAGAATAPPVARGLGATGSVAALNASASNMEVQNASTGQTTVTWTSTTAFSKTVTEAVSALAAGDCVSVTGTPSKKSKTTIAARSITLTSASSSGSCTGFGARSAGGATGQGGGFQFRGGSGGGSGSTSGGPGFGGAGAEGGGSFSRGSASSGSSNFRKALASLAIGSGKVKSVKGSTLTVSGYVVSPGQFTHGTTKSSSKAKKPTTPKTETLTITTSKSTTVSSTQSTAASALAVGDCVSAFGPAASNGAVTASTVRITSTGGGTCTSSFGGFGGGGGSFGGGGGFGGPPAGGVGA
jgi:single-stranded DNA-binding protein